MGGCLYESSSEAVSNSSCIIAWLWPSLMGPPEMTVRRVVEFSSPTFLSATARWEEHHSLKTGFSSYSEHLWFQLQQNESLFLGHFHSSGPLHWSRRGPHHHLVYVRGTGHFAHPVLRARTSMLPPCQSVYFLQVPHTSSRHTYSQLDSWANAPGPGLGTRSKQVLVCLLQPCLQGSSCVLLQAIRENPKLTFQPVTWTFFLLPLGYTYSNHFALEYLFIFTWQKLRMLHFEKQNLKQSNALPITEEGLATVQNILKLFFYTSRFKMSSVRTKKSTACSLIIEKIKTIKRSVASSILLNSLFIAPISLG